MKSAFSIIAGMAIFACSHAYAASCLINDASGMPVNVRADPDGKLLGQLKNGTRVQSDLSSVGGWVYISWDKPLLNKANSGWVYRSFLRCNK
ncbi:SH3 domain-containing protein [Neisseria canis]|uniref:SH3b domain-containing protein n=1 Tax=Neisseria canis TaxID=493 RepID=A0A1X3CXW2_9NEIS|nr:SH3 domain-containing protein [Neisseria canis]OSI12284.1 hypothetical protein BWD07_06190 [Neisseria canis]VEF00761.1 Uncharacterised protein [Neisseria canis]